MVGAYCTEMTTRDALPFETGQGVNGDSIDQTPEHVNNHVSATRRDRCIQIRDRNMKDNLACSCCMPLQNAVNKLYFRTLEERTQHLITAQCYATWSTAMPQYVVRLSVLHNVQVPWSHRLEYFENNFTAKKLKVYTRADSNMGELVQREHPQN